MTDQLMFIIAVAASVAVLALAARSLRRHPLKPFARNLLLGIIAIEAVIAVLHLLSAQNLFSTYWNWFFDLQYERNLGAIFSSVQLLLVAGVALVNAAFTPGLKTWQRLYWLLICATFVYLSLDEFYSYHETFGGRVPTNNWELPYAISGGVLFLLSAGAFWFGFRRDLRTFALFLAGMAILALGAVAIEEFVSEGFVEDNPGLRWMYIFEEMFEMIGATVVLMGFLAYASAHLDSGWRGARRLIAVAGVGWTVWLAFSLLVLPALEARYVADPVDVEYDNGLLSLVGVRVSPEVAQPGDEVALTLYWRANQPLTTNYSLSIHALSHPNIDSVAQSDDLHAGAIPSTAWFPGVVTSRTVYMTLPRNLTVPASYWLAVRVWSGPWPFGRPWSDTVGLPVSDAGNLPLMGEDSVILATIPALPAEAPATTGSPAYRFPDDGFSLVGYALPDGTLQTHQLSADFVWATNEKPPRSLTQFFHLISASGEPFAFDQEPFAGRLPVGDWPANRRFMDSWALTLPDDLPAGTYEVYTGLYDLATMERAPVVDEAGQPVLNNAIHLGTLDYAPDAAVEAAIAQTRPGVCYAVADTNAINGDERDTLVVMYTATGEVAEINQTGGIKSEGIAFNTDHTLLYATDEREDFGQFGVIDLHSGVFTPIGDGLATEDRLASHPAHYESALKDIDSLARDAETGILWGILQDEENLLFQIDPERGAFIPDAFGPERDYVKIDLSDLPAPGYVNVKDLAIQPETGEFFVVLGNDDFDSLLAVIDFDTLDAEAGIVHLRPVAVPNNGGTAIRDVEALSFTPSGELFAISSNNSNLPENYDRLWRLDPETGSATPVGSFTQYVDFVDYEAVACLDAVSAGD